MTTKMIEGVAKGLCATTVVLVVVAALVCFAAGWYLYRATTERAGEPYASSERRAEIEALLVKIDFSGGLLAEWIVAMACGLEFNDAQIEHFIWLVAGYVETARYSYVRIDRIEKRLDKLEEE